MFDVYPPPHPHIIRVRKRRRRIADATMLILIDKSGWVVGGWIAFSNIVC